MPASGPTLEMPTSGPTREMPVGGAHERDARAESAPRRLVRIPWPNSCTVIWRVTPDEHVRAVSALQAYHAKQVRRMTRELRIVALALLALGAAGAIAWRWWKTKEPPVDLIVWVSVPAVLLTVTFFWRRGAVRRAARRQLLDNPLTLQERRYTFDARGLSIAGETFEDKFAWREVSLTTETPEFFLIFANRSAYYLPKRAVVWPETLEGLREVFVERMGEKARVR